MSKTNYKQTKKFIDCLYPEFVWAMTFEDRGYDYKSLDQLLKAAHKLNKQGNNVRIILGTYWQQTTQDAIQLNLGNGVVTALWVDIKYTGTSHDFLYAKKLALASLYSMPLQPSMIVDAHDSLQGYWLLQESDYQEHRAGRKIQNFHGALASLTFPLGLSFGAHQEDKELRDVWGFLPVPGLINYSVEGEPMVNLLYSDSTRRYRWEEFDVFADPLLCRQRIAGGTIERIAPMLEKAVLENAHEQIALHKIEIGEGTFA